MMHAWGFSTADEIIDLQLESNACAWHPARRSVDGDFGNYCNLLRAICKFGKFKHCLINEVSYRLASWSK